MHSLSRRLAGQQTLKAEYETFMREYEELGHMSRLSASNVLSTQTAYIPHHPVLRPDSTTTRLRVVFNASSLTSNRTSLNDHLLAGPKLQTELPAILLQWRQFRFVYTADIAKMYRQILVDSRDRDYQRILWHSEVADNPQEFQLNTVTYGMNCAPFLALRVLHSLIEDEGDRFPLATPILKNQTYVDDVLFGDHDTETLRQRRDQLITLLGCGHFQLRKWASNTSDLLADINPKNHGLACSHPLAPDDAIKILGIAWHPSRDAFQYKVSLDESVPTTKRTILSAIAKLYDPLGWVTPVTITAKIFMQQLSRSKLEWDQPLAESVQARWHLIYTSLAGLNDVSLPRWVKSSPSMSTELHGFSDASNLAYAAAVYIRVLTSSGRATVSLLAGKSRVAPINSLTVPRLELSAALLLSNLLIFVRDVLQLHSSPCICWTDSTVTLAWLRSHPSRWNTFVANRVAKIHSALPNVTWRHVPTTCNPADCASRGILGNELTAHNLWWSGPSWLSYPSNDWPETVSSISNQAPIEERTRVHYLIDKPDVWDISSRYSSWNTLIRVTAYLFRFIHLCRKRDGFTQNNLVGGQFLTSNECRHAEIFWLRALQAHSFSTDITKIKAGRVISSKNPILSLTPFLDGEGLLRVGGRLENSPLPYDSRHPFLLAPHPLVRLLIRQVHLRHLHAGLQLTLSILRRKYWVVRARSLVKSVIHECVTCARERAAIPSQLMGQLPTSRISPVSRCFAHCGVDFAGPVKIRASAGRGIATRKSYIVLFVCLSTRAIHLELVGDLTTPAFINSFSRFCARRGLPNTMYSDNGTTFVGTNKELAVAYRTALRDPNFFNQTASDGIQWCFIPPSAPHFGGLWEAGVRCMKHHLRRVIGCHTLSFEEFSTLLCKIEACLNSRPIAPLSDNLDDYQCLTPGHFLIGAPPTIPPQPSILELNENQLSR